MEPARSVEDLLVDFFEERALDSLNRNNREKRIEEKFAIISIATQDCFRLIVWAEG